MSAACTNEGAYATFVCMPISHALRVFVALCGKVEVGLFLVLSLVAFLLGKAG